MSRVQGKAFAVSSGICIAAGLAGVVIMQSLDMPRRELARVSVPEALNLVQDQQVRQRLSARPYIDPLELLFSEQSCQAGCACSFLTLTTLYCYIVYSVHPVTMHV